jgi:D-alanine transfer protein
MGDAGEDRGAGGAAAGMNPWKKTLIAVCPLFMAFLLTGVCFILPVSEWSLSDARLERAASSLSDSVLKGEAVKKRAMQLDSYVPFLGSSEWRRFDAFHPSVLAKKYDRAYRPFLLGTAGTQCLTHFLSLHSMDESLSGKPAVFVISPQWFQYAGVEEASFEEFFSPIQIYDWLCDDDADPVIGIYFAKRMLTFQFIQNDAFFKDVFTRISDGKTLSRGQRQRCENRLRVLQAEDRFYGWFFIENHLRKILAGAKELPDRYDPGILDRLAFLDGEADAYNNVFRIKNSFYNWRIKPKLKSFKGDQKDVSYDSSPEYGDFQLMLSELARNRMRVLFVIPPVNRRWADYTGLPMNMYLRFVKKIRFQLNGQGFTDILDLSGYGSVDYFMEDTIHLGWRGWVTMDRFVEPFLRTKEPAPEYRIDPYFCSREWAEKVMDEAKP